MRCEWCVIGGINRHGFCSCELLHGKNRRPKFEIIIWQPRNFGANRLNIVHTLIINSHNTSITITHHYQTHFTTSPSASESQSQNLHTSSAYFNTFINTVGSICTHRKATQLDKRYDQFFQHNIQIKSDQQNFTCPPKQTVRL